MSGTFQGMNGIIQQLKDQADEEERRRQAEAQAAMLRAQVPVGPLPRPQPVLGPVTKEQAQARGWNPSTPAQQPISIPQPKPFPQVQGPVANTSTPPISSTQQAPTLQSVTPQYVPKTPTPEVPKPHFNVPSLAPTQPQPAPSPLAQWRGAPPVAAIPAMFPQLQTVGNAAVGLAKAVIPQNWQAPDYGKALGQLAQQGQQALGNMFSGQPTGSPADFAWDVYKQSVEQRHKEKLYTSTALPDVLNLYGNTKSQLESGEQALRLGMDAIELMGLGTHLVSSMRVGKTPDAQTLGTQFAKLYDVGQQTSATAASPTDLALLSKIPGVDATVSGINAVSGFLTGNNKVVDPSLFAFLDPKAWQSLGNMTTYWNVANTKAQSILSVSPAQGKTNTPEQIAYAKNFATFMMPYSGLDGAQKLYQEKLDTPGIIADATTQAQDLIKQADSAPSDAERTALLSEAGRIGAQALKTRETTVLDLYNKYWNPRYGLFSEFLMDPMQWYAQGSELAHLTPAARRYSSAQKLVELGKDEVGGNKGVTDAAMGLYKQAMQTNRSKSMSDAFTVHDVLSNLLSGVYTKGDIITTMTKVLDGTIKDGIPLAELNGSEQALAATNGVVPFGWSGVNDFRFQEAKKSFQNALGWIPNLPSLTGEPTELANKTFVQGDILGMLTRAAAQSHNVSTMADVPYGAKAFEVIPALAGKATVQWIGDGKQVLGQSAEMTLREATKMQKSLTKALTTGSEFQTNYIKSLGDLERSIVSGIGLNPNVGNMLGNWVGGNFQGLVNGTALDFRSLEEKVGELVAKGGGFYPNARLAEGIGGVQPAKAVTYGVQKTGTYDGLLGKLLNISSLGLGKWGREIRQGATTIFGQPFGEEAMTANIYHSAFTSFFNKEWPKVEPMMADLLKGKVENPDALRFIYDRIVHAGLKGNRIDVARAFNEVADGKIALSLRTLGPYISDVLTSDHALEIDKLLSDLRPENLATTQSRIKDIFNERLSLLNSDAPKFVETGPGRYFFTQLHDQQDVAEAAQQFKVAAKSIGASPDEAMARAARVQTLKEEVNRKFLSIMQVLNEQPDMGKYLADIYDSIDLRTATTRRRIGEGYQAIHDATQQLPAGSAGPMPSDSLVADMWKKQYETIRTEWEQHGKEVGTLLEQARSDIASGRPQAEISKGIQSFFGLRGMQPGAENDIGDVHTFLSDLNNGTEEAKKWIGQKVGFKGYDPKYDVKLNNIQDGYRSAKARMFAMLSRYPHMGSFDEYQSAFRDIDRVRGRVLGTLRPLQDAVTAAKASGDVALERQAKAILNSANNKQWDQYWASAIGRLEAGAFRIGEINLPPEWQGKLTFTLPGSQDSWRLMGPSMKFANQWDVEVKDAAGALKYTTLPTASDTVAGVPKALLNTYKGMKQAIELDLTDQIAKFGAQTETAFPAASGDDIIRKSKSLSKDMVQQIRQRVAEYMANYKQQTFLPQDVQGHYRQALNAGVSALNNILQEVAVANGMGHGKLDLDTISQFNEKILPHFDNVFTGAQDYGRKIASISMVDFTNNYHPDVLLSLGFPYHYWWTRMAKNALEQMLSHPKVAAGLGETFRAIEAHNRDEGQPNRNVDSLPFGVTIGDVQYRPGASVLTHWIPFAPNMVGSGYSDPEIANQQHEYIKDASTQQGFPATQNKLAAQAMYDYEVAKQMGLSPHGWWDKMVDWASGNPVSWSGFLGDMSPLHRALGYGAVRMANWAKDNNIPLVQQAAQGYASATIPGYFPYLTGRNAAFEAGRGNLTDPQAQMVQDVGRQDYTGLSPMPEQAFLDPNAAKQYEDLQNKTATEYFIRNLLTFISGVPIAANNSTELKLMQAEALKRLSGYSADNPSGSQAAKYGYTTPGNPNFVPGLAPFESKYAVTAEAAPGQPDSSVTRPGRGAAQTAYYAEKDAIYKKYKDAAQAMYTAHPEWSDRTTNGPASDWKNAQSDALKLDLQNLDTKYPTISTQEKGPSPYSLSGARPSEVIQLAQQRLITMANKNLEGQYPPDGSPPAAYDAYKAKMVAEVNRLMQDPGLVLYNDPQSEARDIGRHPQGGSVAPGNSVLPSTTGASPTVSPAVPPVSGALPSSPYAADFSAAETANGLPAGLLAAVQANETTDGNASAVSPAGAVGLMQIMPATWKEWAPKVGATDPNNPQDSIKVAAAYLAWLQATLPDGQKSVKDVATAYNFGIARVLRGETPPPETTAYADRIANAVQNVPGGQSPDSNVQSAPWNSPVIQGYGANPDAYKKFGLAGHDGIDYDVPVGTPLPSVANGTVAAVGYDPTGWGHYVGVDIGNKTYVFFGHLSQTDVKQGQAVSAGDVLGLSGGVGPERGNSSGAHLHVTVRVGGTTQKYNVDPSSYVAQWTGSGTISSPAGSVTPELGGSSTQLPTAPVSAQVPAASPVSPVGAAPSANGFPWGGTAEDLIAQHSAAGKAPAQLAAETAVDAQYKDIDARAVAAYPQGAGLYQEYRALADADKKAWTAAHPLIRAMHLAGYDPDQYQYMEQNFGKGIVEKWANIPPYTGEGDDSASKYYHANPDVFVAKAWLQGRPEVHDASTFDPNAPFEYDSGTDFETAKQMFGDNIWSTVRQYYTLPPYVKGGDNTQWLAFKKDHPEYDPWRTWWYANLPGQQASTFTGYQGRGYARAGHGNGFSGGHSPGQINRVPFVQQSPPQFHNPGNGDAGWRQWLALTEADLKSWRR